MNSPEIIITQIEHHKQQWDYDSALKVALEWLNTHINDYRFYEELADIYIYQENIEKAEEVISYARELHPTSGTGLFLEGYILAEKGDYQKAIEILERANNLFPNNAEILRNIGWSHVMLENMQKWIAILRRAHTLAPDDEKIKEHLDMAQILYSSHSHS